MNITTDLERDLLALLFDPKYSDMSLDQIRTLASGYVMPEIEARACGISDTPTKLYDWRDETPSDGR